MSLSVERSNEREGFLGKNSILIDFKRASLPSMEQLLLRDVTFSETMIIEA